MDYTTSVEPREWYSWKRAHPKEYKVIEEYIFDRFSFVTLDYEGQTYTNLLIPRLFFTYGEMLGFLSRYHHLREYEHIRYSEYPYYKGGTQVRISIDFKAIAQQETCDYMWREVRELLACHIDEITSKPGRSKTS